MALYFGNPSAHTLAGVLYNRTIAKALGSTNVFSASTVDQMPKHVSSGLLFGGPLLIPVPDLDRTDHLIMLGANPWESNGSLCTAPDFPGRVKAIQARGGKVVVVDPRFTRTAQEADEHVAVRPGSDAHLLVAMANVLFAEGLVDLGHAPPTTSLGLDELREAVAPFTPEAVASICGIEPEVIRHLARDLAAAPSAAVYGRIGTHTAEFGTIAAWAVDVLNTLTGNLDRPGGAMFPLAAHDRPDRPGPGRGFLLGRHRSRVRGFGEVNGELPVATLAEEIETPGDGPGAGAHHGGRQPGRVHAEQRPARRRARLARVHGERRHLPERDHPPRQRDPAGAVAARAQRVPDGVLRAVGAQLRRVGAADRRAQPIPMEHETIARIALILGGQGADADVSAIDDMMICAACSTGPSPPRDRRSRIARSSR